MTAHDLKLDYFTVYTLRSMRLAIDLALHGQFDHEVEPGTLMGLPVFALPATKNREAIVDPNANLAGYSLHQEVPDPLRTVEVENQFGRQTFQIGQPLVLFVPASRERLPFPKLLDHYKVYDVLEGHPVDKTVEIHDPFGGDERHVTIPVAFGVPVVKHFKDKVSRIENERAHLTLYRLLPVRKVQHSQRTTDQFGRRFLSFLYNAVLAVPTLKHGWKEA